jgi:hypothetical protein
MVDAVIDKCLGTYAVAAVFFLPAGNKCIGHSNPHQRMPAYGFV